MPVPRPRVELTLRGGERVHPRAGKPGQVMRALGKILSRCPKLGSQLGDRRGRLSDDLQLRGGHLELETRVTFHPLQDPRGDRSEVARLPIEQQELLLGADRELMLRVERSAHRCRRLNAAHAGNSVLMRLFTVPGVFRPRSDSWMLARR